MKIGELARQAGLNASAIRYYERVGLLPRADRRAGQRHYAPEALDQVLLIRFASDMGFSLGEIRLFLRGLRGNMPVGPRWRKLAARKIMEVGEMMERSRRLKGLLERIMECHCASLKMCVGRLKLSPDLKLLERERKTR